ncbi:hypothetical protein C8J57DRAFT_1545659 [Mycena rebaudengoi]|nr:hypothetical protein C8J57DRAFT_1545659 [Mycena rebaudengoi]
MLWDPAIHANFLAAIPTASVLATIFYHYERRRKWIKDVLPAFDGKSDLALCQNVVRQRYSESGASTCIPTIMVALKPGSCKHAIHEPGHETLTPASPPECILPINVFDLEAARDWKGPACSLSDYLACSVPRISGGNEIGVTTLVHTQLPLLCAHPECLATISRSPTINTMIETSWLRVLQITLESATVTRLPITSTISLQAGPGKTDQVEYSLVGTVSYHSSHWTSNILLQ